MIILHNKQDRNSRTFVENLPDELKDDVIEWYTEPEKVTAYITRYPGFTPSVFPSVLVEVPAYRIPERVFEGIELVTENLIERVVLAHDIPTHYELLHSPSRYSNVFLYIADVELRAVENPSAWR